MFAGRVKIVCHSRTSAILKYFCLFPAMAVHLGLHSLSTYPFRFSSIQMVKSVHLIALLQAFRFMVGPSHFPMISKYGPSLSKAVGPMDPFFLVVKKSHFNNNIHLTASL